MKHKARAVAILLLCLGWGQGTRAEVSKMESEYLRLAARYEQREDGVQKELKTYLKEYAYTTYEDEVRFMIGALSVERGQYKQSLKELEQVEYNALGRNHQPQYQFYRGYAYLMMQEYSRASVYFAQLKKGNSDYQIKGTYYYGYCLYKEQKFDKALPVFLSLEQNQEYSKTIPYYIVQIYYAQHNYEEVKVRANQLLSKYPDSDNNAELNRILGEIDYHDGLYASAVSRLTNYKKVFSAQGQELVRNDLYLLGMAQYKTEDYASAIQSFKQVKQQKDTISEATLMTMGNCYVKLGQFEQAKLSYQGAMTIGITPQVKEEAMFNYTLCAYQSSTALGESVTAFTDFIKQYPNSKHEEQVYSLMSDALMQSKNYPAALAALDSIQNPTRKMLDIKQYLRFQMGTDAFVQGKMEQAKQWFSEVIKQANAGDAYKTEAYYWRAEAAYRLRQYTETANDLKQYYLQNDVRRSPNYRMAGYLNGYTLFNSAKYTDAKTAFQRYADATQQTEPTYADALNRIGDCYFNARDFGQAITAYGQVIDLNATGSDYATFQKGYAQGLQRKYNDKIRTMESLVNRYPKSDFADDALYEKARAQLQIDHQRDAIASYSQLLDKYPHSNMARKASVERAMLYRNLGENDNAIEAYKKTIANYPGSEEAYTALEGLESVYVETNRISEYLAYTKQLGRLNMSITTKEDSLCFAAAELQYMLGNYQQAAAGLTTYLSQYCPGGRYCTSAQYYAADSYYRLGKTTEALHEYKALTEIGGNPYMEEACTRVAGLSYDKKDYNTAIDYFYKMLSLSSNRENTDIARLGILRCSYYLGRHQATIDIATQILNDQPVAETVKEEALYNRAKSLIEQKQFGQAIVDLTPLSQEVRTAIGSEAKYLLADCYFQLKALDNSEQEIMSFAQQQTQHQYWLAKALILLSDINVVRGDDFQAQQYLLTLQRNYTQQDDIQKLVSERLSAIEQRQSEKVEE